MFHTEDEKLVIEEGKRLTTMYGEGSTAWKLGGAILRLVRERAGARAELDKEAIKRPVELRNESPHEFKKIIGRRRHYQFPGGDVVTINGPRWLYVSKSGGHRIVDDDGIGHYVPPGWIHLWWSVAHFEPHFTI